MVHETINIAVKFAEIDDMPYSGGQDGWVSRFVQILQQTLEFYFPKPVVVWLKKETDLIDEKEFQTLDAVIYVLSPAFLFSSNISVEISAIEKAVLFDTDHLNSKIHKVLKGPVNVGELPVTISMGAFHYFYQADRSGESSYETLFDRDNSALARNKYWESFTNLIFNLLKHLRHPGYRNFVPPNEQVVFLGTGDVGQLWERTDLFGELNSRGVKVLPDHDHSIEVKHLNDPLKFYLKKSHLAIHFPEEFLPLDTKKLQSLADLPELKRFIWFNPEAEKEVERKKLYDELKQKLKNLEHVEVVSSGLEELKEIIFAATREAESGEKENEPGEGLKVYIIWAEHFHENKRAEIINIIKEQEAQVLLQETGKVQEKRAQHYQNLREADYCLICYDGKNPNWLRANINEVKKATGLNPEKKRKIRLGVAGGEGVTAGELGEFSAALTSGTLSFIPAFSPSLQNDLNNYINGR